MVYYTRRDAVTERPFFFFFIIIIYPLNSPPSSPRVSQIRSGGELYREVSMHRQFNVLVSSCYTMQLIPTLITWAGAASGLPRFNR